MTGIIKVDTIQNNGGTTAMTIDSSGRDSICIASVCVSSVLFHGNQQHKRC